MNTVPQISVVIPLLNEESNIEVLYQELDRVLTEMRLSYEIIFSDDGSTDRSFEIIKKLNTENPRVKGVSLSRNFGHQIALTAGISHATGETVAMMDADMQHPPVVLKQLYELYLQGYDIVNTRRIYSEEISRFKRSTSAYFYRFINSMADIKIEPASSDYRLMSRKAVDAFLQFNERDRFMRGLISWMGFKQTAVEYEAPPRFSGKSKYTLKKMLRFALSGITSFSTKPLQLAIYTGIAIFGGGVLYAIYAIISYFWGHTIEGWTSLMVTVLIIGGFQLLSLGVIGEYIGRIFNESKARPIYFIKERTSE